MTCGSLPPNTNGGKAFIHDPKISDTADTKASIKLKFCTTQGKEVLAFRSFLLTNKKDKQEFKKME
jgi:DNA repair protein RAD50